MSDRVAAQKAYAEMQKSSNPSTFDVMGAFSKHYNKPGSEESFSIPLDFAKAITPNQRRVILENFNPTTRGVTRNPRTEEIISQLSPDKQQVSAWTKIAEGLETGYNLAAQAVTFGLALPEKNNPLWRGEFNVNRISKSWEAARQISPGQALVASNFNPFTAILGSIEALPGSLGDKFVKDHALFAASDFDLYDSAQRREAFTEQNLGLGASFTSDVIARFVIDPTIFLGKGIKAYKTAKYAIKSADEFAQIIGGVKEGRKADRIRATFTDFLEKTDDMSAQDLFRVKAIRESANPAVLSDLLSTANKVEDKAARHMMKTDIIHMAMGDADAFTRLANANEILAMKVASLMDEVPSAKYFAGNPEKTSKSSQLTFDYLNNGTEYEKSLVLIKELEGEIDDIHKQMSAVGIMDPKKVPFIDAGSGIRQQFVNSQNFIDLRAGYAGVLVRFHTGFFYKRPRGWIDYTDNQSVQTVDNQLSRVVGLADNQRKAYQTEIDKLEFKISNTDDVKVIEDLKSQVGKVKGDMDKATFTVERRSQLFDEYINAADENARAAAHARIEEELFTTVAKQFGYDEADVRRAYGAFANSRQKVMNLIKERAYTGATSSENGLPVGAKLRAIVDEDGVQHVIPIPAPILETQLAKQMPTLDIDTMYKVLKRYHAAETLTKYGKVRSAYSGAMKAKNGVGDIVDGLDQFLKFQVLARLGYPMRNVTEGNMRIFSLVGGMAVLQGIAGASKQGASNLYNRTFGKNAAKEVLEFAEKAELEAKRIELLLARDFADDPLRVDAQIFEIDQVLAGKAKPSAQMGVGKIQMHGLTLEDAKGLTDEQAAFYNEKFVATAGQVVDTSLTRVKDSISNSLQATGDFVKVKGTDPNWEDAYLRVVNQQLKGSAIGRLFLQGKTVDDVELFLSTTTEGRRIFRALGMGRTPRDLAEANGENFRHLFPEWQQGKLLAIANERKITPKDLTKYFGTDASIRPDVNGSQIADVIGGNGVTRLSSMVANSFYKTFGELPESTLVKSPLYVNLYRRRLNALVENAIETTTGDVVDPRYLRSLEGKARQWARSEMRRTLYDVSEKTDAASTLKYAFPFFGAYSDVAEKWLRIASKDPSAIRKLQTVYESPDRLGMTEERDGLTYINIPGEWSKRMGIDRPIAIPKASLNLIFQGGAWWNPGAGWFVQAAASQLVSRYTSLEKTKFIEEILPYGAQDKSIKDLVVQSAAARKIIAAFDESDPMRVRMTALVTAEENAKYDQGLRGTAPTKAEINDRVMKTLGMEIAARLTLPFATNTRSPYQFYIDEFHRLRQEDANTAGDKFYEMYGDDYYNFTLSLSKNNTGIASTISADKRSKELADLIAKDPEYGWFLVGDANSGEFSPTVYGNQFQQSVAPGSTVKFRETADPYEAFDQLQVDKGWKQYRQGMAIIEARRIAGGFKSLNSRGAEELKAQKAIFQEALAKEIPAWGQEFGKIDTQRVNNFLRYATDVIKDKRLAGRQDIQTLKDYLEGRDYIRQLLAGRSSTSLDNEGNLDIRERWDEFIGSLLDEDVTFERVYTRILEKDDLQKGF